MEKNTPAVIQPGSALNYADPEVVSTLKQTVAKGTTDAEFALFVQQCKATGLNPFKKEIWCIKTKEQLQLMTGVNGYYEIANRHPMFDGIETEVVEDGKRIVKAVAKVYRKDRARPTTAEAYLEEYGKSYGNWQKMPRVMLSKCAESMALRKAFPQELNGTYTDAEMPAEYSGTTVAVEVATASIPSNGTTPKPEKSSEFHQPDTLEAPARWKLESPRSSMKGQTLAEIHEADPRWIDAVMNNPKKRDALTQRDRKHVLAFAAALERKEAREIIDGEFTDDEIPMGSETPLGEQIEMGGEVD